MTTIRQNAEYATLINVFTVEPDRARQLADLLSRSHRGSDADICPGSGRPTST